MTPPPPNWTTSAIVWLGLGGLFLVLELTGYWHITPWSTLSDYIWHLEAAKPEFRWAVWFVCSLLLTHLVAQFP